jgi:hypothetical protein
MPNLVTGTWRDESRIVVLAVHNFNAPSDDEWEQYCSNIARHVADDQTVGIAFTDGGGPNSAQRDRVRAELRERTPRSAVISRSLIVRGVVTALSWFNPLTAAFSPEQVNDAFEFAGIRASQVVALWDAVLALDQRLTPQSRVIAEIVDLMRNR